MQQHLVFLKRFYTSRNLKKHHMGKKIWKPNQHSAASRVKWCPGKGHPNWHKALGYNMLLSLQKGSKYPALTMINVQRENKLIKGTSLKDFKTFGLVRTQSSVSCLIRVPMRIHWIIPTQENCNFIHKTLSNNSNCWHQEWFKPLIHPKRRTNASSTKSGRSTK